MRKSFKGPYRVKKKRSIFSSRFLWFGVLFLLFSGAVFYFLFLSDFFQVKGIIITGEKKASEERLKALVEKKLENEILFFKTKSIFLVDLDKTRKDILNNFPKILEIGISREFPETLNVVVAERFGLASWHQDSRYFLLDSEGVIFEEILEAADLIKITDKRNVGSFLLGEGVIEKELLSQVLMIAQNLEEDLMFEEFSVISDERINVKTSEGWEIYFNPKEDIDWQLTKLNLVLEKQIPPQKREELEYIELRFGNQAYYK